MSKVNPTVRTRDEHTLSRRDMDEDALKVLYRLSRNGFTAYLVGGGVRDLLLGRKPKDFDVSTDARPRQIKRLFRNSFIIGRRFRLVHVRFGDNVIEVSTFRRSPDKDDQADDSDLYHDNDNTFGTPEEDAFRRDFTVNAMFYDIRTFEVIDHVGGLQDLADGIIRCIGDPEVRFQEDPVRMLRAVRFASRLGFTIEDDAFRAIQQYREHLRLAPAPRLLEELYKLFHFGAGEEALHMLVRTGLVQDLLPEWVDFLNADSPESDLFWKLLGGLDARHRDKPPCAELIFATLLLAPHRELVRMRREREERVDSELLARELLEPLALRLRVPKRVFYRVIQILDGQRRFESTPRRFSKTRFAAQDGFPLMLELREIYVEACGQDASGLGEWRQLAREHSPAKPESDVGAPRRRRRRSPRRRRRRASGPGGGSPDAT